MIDHNQPYITIIGAGVGGLCMAMQLKKAGFHNFVILEKRDGPGGTWRDNTYPGCACDVPSMFYSFSFETKRDWSRLFPGQAEILGYLEHCIEKHFLDPHLRFNAEVARAEFQEAEGCWRLELADGEALRTSVLVSSVGQLNQPAWPDLPGMERFKGTAFHSARWDHGKDLAGQRVAVIGNGCSAAQFVPEVAKAAAEVSVFQRSAHWVIPRNDHAFPPAILKAFQRHPLLVKLYRYFIWLRYELTLFPIMRRKSRRRAKMEQAALEHMKATIEDAEMIEALTPDYDIGCKRVIIDDTYYPALARDNVSLVTTPIREVTETGLTLSDGSERPFDAIIYGTGFRTNEFLTPMEITGLGGKSLNDAWRQGAEAHLGIAVSGFPNFFMTYGPNTNLGHNSIIFMIEAQVRYILQCIEALNRRGVKYLNVRPEAQSDFNAGLQKSLDERSIWATECASWYKNSAGKVVNNWKGTTLEYWFRTRRPIWSQFQEALSAPRQADG